MAEEFRPTEITACPAEQLDKTRTSAALLPGRYLTSPPAYSLFSKSSRPSLSISL